MRYLMGFNYLILAASTTMALVLSVVLLIYWVYRDEPIIQASFESLSVQTGIFISLALFSGLATQALRKRFTAYWLLQAGLLMALIAVVNFYLPE